MTALEILVYRPHEKAEMPHDVITIGSNRWLNKKARPCKIRF